MTYIPAFDPFAASYRMLHILTPLQQDEVVEADRLCIFDFYLLFPPEAHHIRLRGCVLGRCGGPSCRACARAATGSRLSLWVTPT